MVKRKEKYKNITEKCDQFQSEWRKTIWTPVITREYIKNKFVIQYNHLEKMGRFVERQKLPKLTQEEIEKSE